MEQNYLQESSASESHMSQIEDQHMEQFQLVKVSIQHTGPPPLLSVVCQAEQISNLHRPTPSNI